MQNAPTWETIAPLVVKTEPNDAMLMVTFKCPVSGQEMMGGAPMMAGVVRAGAKNAAASTAKQSLFGALRRWIIGLVGGGAGASIAASAATDAAAASAEAAGPKVKMKHSEAEVQAAAVKAFEQMVQQGTFVWSDAHGSYALAHALAN